MTQTKAQLIDGKSAEIEFSGGSAGAPAISFTGDTNTGIYSPGADQLALSTNGTGRLFVDANGLVDVQSNSASVTRIGGGASWFIRRAEGSYSAPTAISSSVNLGGVAARGYGTTDYRAVGNMLFTSDGAISDSSSPGYITFATTPSASTTPQERLRITSAGLVGVGTSSPSDLLSLAGSGTILGFASGPVVSLADTSGRTLKIAGPGAITNAVIGTTTNHDLQFITGNTVRATFDTSGRLGIGNSNPGYPLDVQSEAGGAGLRIRGGSSGLSVLQFTDNAISSQWGAISTASTSCNIEHSSIVRFTTASTERVRIDSSGRVGIGTSSVGELLHLNGASAALQIQDSGATNSIGKIINSSGILYIQSQNNTSHGQIAFRTSDGSATERARIDSSGRLLIGTSSTSTNALLQVQGNQSNSIGSGDLHLRRGEAATSIASGEGIGYIAFTDNAGGTFGAIECVADAAAGTNDYPGRLTFSTTADGASSPTEHMKIAANGAVKMTTNGTYFITSSVHEMYQHDNNYIAYFINAHASAPYGISVRFKPSAPNGTGNPFYHAEDNNALRFEVRSNGGIANYSANNANLSDRNAKKDISLAAGTWDCLKQWEIVNYRYKDQPDDADLNLGVIAQQVAESCPEVITVFQEAKEATETEPAQEERLGVKEQQMYWMAIKALQEAQVRIEALEAEVAALKAQ